MKKNLGLFLLALILLVPAFGGAWAAQRGSASEQSGPHMGLGPQHSGAAQAPMTPEQMAAYDKIMTEHYSKTQALRSDIWAKQTELDYLAGSDKTDAATIHKLVGELKDLRLKMQNERSAAAARLSKEFGIGSGQAYGLMRLFGRHGDGYGGAEYGGRGRHCSEYGGRGWHGGAYRPCGRQS